MDNQGEPVKEHDVLSDQVREVSEASKNAGTDDSHEAHEDGEKEHLPEGVKDRLWRQERKHQREIRQMKAQLEGLHSRLNSASQSEASEHAANHYADQQQGAGIDDQIHKAVSYALRAKEEEERRAKDAERQHHVNRQYQELNKHLDHIADKYDDFDDTVRGESTPFTVHMRDAALLLPRNGSGSAGEVLYKLGKNPTELDRISRLHPLDQASEMVKLSHALIRGDDMKSQSPRPLGQIKSNPVSNSHAVTEKTPVSELRARMKAGWK